MLSDASFTLGAPCLCQRSSLSIRYLMNDDLLPGGGLQRGPAPTLLQMIINLPHRSQVSRTTDTFIFV